MVGKLSGEPPRWQGAVFQGTEWLILGALTPIAYFLGKRQPLNRASWKKTLAIHAGGSLLLCFGWATLGIIVATILHTYPAEGPIRTSYMIWLLVSLPYSVFIYFSVLGCFYAYTYFVEARDRQTQAAMLASQLSEARLQALRMQLNPHFLFNSLNALSILVREQNIEDAARVLDLLSDVLRRVLKPEPRQLEPLSRELEFLEQYLSIEQIRFSDRLRVIWRIDVSVREALVPTLLLQPIVENAIRHGIAKRADSGLIEIEAVVQGNSLVLIVRDDGAGRPESNSSVQQGVGLSNTKERLNTLYGESASLRFESGDKVGSEVIITLPFILERQ